MTESQTILHHVLELKAEVGELRADVATLKLQEARIRRAEDGVSTVKLRQHFLSGAYAGAAAILGYVMRG